MKSLKTIIIAGIILVALIVASIVIVNIPASSEAEVDETATEVHLADSLGENGKKFFTDNKVPMVLPDIDFFSINLNRLHGDIPNWLKYHPKLDMWTPLLLVFPQEGKDSNGNRAGFNQEPTNLNYYYDIYEKKEWSDVNVIE